MRALLVVDNPGRQTALIEWLRQVGNFEQVACVSFAELERLPVKPDENETQLLVIIKASSTEDIGTQLEKSWHHFPDVPLLMLPDTPSVSGRQPVAKTGAFASEAEVEHAVRLASAGHPTGPPRPAAQDAVSADVLTEAGKLELTLRQYQILVLLSMGHPQKIISRMLDISLATVKSHAAQLYTRLGASNKTEAIYMARQRGARLVWQDPRGPDQAS